MEKLSKSTATAAQEQNIDVDSTAHVRSFVSYERDQLCEIPSIRSDGMWRRLTFLAQVPNESRRRFLKFRTRLCGFLSRNFHCTLRSIASMHRAKRRQSTRLIREGMPAAMTKVH